MIWDYQATLDRQEALGLRAQKGNKETLVHPVLVVFPDSLVNLGQLVLEVNPDQ